MAYSYHSDDVTVYYARVVYSAYTPGYIHRDIIATVYNILTIMVYNNYGLFHEYTTLSLGHWKFAVFINPCFAWGLSKWQTSSDLDLRW